MRYFQIVAPITYEFFDRKTGETKRLEKTHEDIVIRHVLNVDPKFAKPREHMKIADRIEAAVKGKPAGAWVSLESKDWEMLKDCVNDMAEPFFWEVGKQLTPFFDAILDATDQLPDELKVKAANGAVTHEVVAEA